MFTINISSKTVNYKKNKLNIDISRFVGIMQNVKTAQSASDTSVTKITFVYKGNNTTTELRTILYERSRQQLRYLKAQATNTTETYS
jgi:hypothetical protein